MHELPLIATLAVGFTAAWVLGLVTQWLRMSPIVGYLLAGILVGPHTPGFVADLKLAHELAEIGVILLMFGVGLHFHLKDLLAVRAIALPGALVQSVGATLASVGIFHLLGLETRAGMVIGMAMSVASTVVLMRVLMDANALASPAGHVAVGWLLVEDVLTVIVLVLIPVLGGTAATGQGGGAVMQVVVALGKLVALVLVVLVAGARVIPWVLLKVARLRSRELFTLTTLVFSVAIAAGAYAVFGASMALGAFLAGMVVAQSPVSHQAAADALPMRDAFAVLFFVSVGMLFDPMFLVREPMLMLAAMVVILVVKPLIALLLVAALGHSSRTALTVAIGLAQIGEFSFILSELARRHGLMPESGSSLLVGGAILSITLNPFLFRSIDRIENRLKRHPRLWRLLNARAERRVAGVNNDAAAAIAGAGGQERLAIVVGYGPVGRTVDRLLRDSGLSTVVIDLNMDTVLALEREGHRAIFGDASREAILDMAGVRKATHLLLTLPHSTDRVGLISTARSLNPRLRIFVRARYLSERGELEQAGATTAVFEEGEAAVALARQVLTDTGATRESVERAVHDIRIRLILENVSALRAKRVSAIMIPWTRVRRLSDAAGLEEVRRHVGEQHFSRWPVTRAGTGEPVGYLLAKDLIGLRGEHDPWTHLVRPVSSLHPNDTIESALQHFQREAASVCLVKDGASPVGLVTLEDILGQMVGRIEDEYPRHPPVALAEVLWTEDTLLDLRASSADEAIAEMAACIPPNRRAPGRDIAALALSRERELGTGIGFGVAIPHARCPELPGPVVVFGRSRAGIPFGAPGEEPVDLVFLLVTPASQPDLQVQLLSRIAAVAGDARRREELRRAGSCDEVLRLLAEEGGRPAA